MLRIKLSDLEKLLAQLQDMPRQMETKSRESWEMRQRVAALQKNIDDERYAIEFEIRTNRDLYKNEAERAAAIKVKMSQNDVVLRLQKEIDSYDEEREIIENQKWRLKDEFTVLKYTLRASCAVIEGLSDPIVREAIDDRSQEQLTSKF